MVLEADRLGCADEVDRDRRRAVDPGPARAAGRTSRRRPTSSTRASRTTDSDFLAYLNLWRYLREQQRELSGNQFRKRCKAEFLHYLRVREWQDLVAQLRGAAKEVGRHDQPRAAPSPTRSTRRCWPGCSRTSGCATPPGASTRARAGRGSRSSPAPVLARKQPTWVMVAELVETSRLWGRTAARIEPEWVEPLAEHLVKRSYSEPRWERRRGAVVATERVTLYGLPIVAGRTVPYARIDPELARELFIRRALVEEDWDTRHAFVAGEPRAGSRRSRRWRSACAGATSSLPTRRASTSSTSGSRPTSSPARTSTAGGATSAAAGPSGSTTRARLLVVAGAEDVLDPQAWPTGWRQGDLVLRLSYRFEPGHPHDGVTVHVPLQALPQLQPDGFEWLVPAFRLELVTTLLRSLPKELRRPLVPVPDVAAQVLGRA